MTTEHFFDTGFTIPPDMGFEHFGAGHLLWLLFAAALFTVSGIVYNKSSEKSRRKWLVAVAVLLVTDELFKDTVTVCFGRFRLDYLPLHLCSINIFIILADVIRPSETLREVLYAVCLPGAFFALLFPGWSFLPIFNALCIHSFTAHILLFLYPLLLICGGFEPKLRRFLKALPFFIPVVTAVYFFNKRFDTNFMFLNYAGEGNPLTLFEKYLGSPMYLIGIPVLCLLSWAILYGAPAIIRKVLQSKGK